ncbi:MAG: hypothetical protein DLM57_00195 [Pseudonocardiales bacterium]|nr:MAG: hypothetical protein DLM57_00195 [Pseudonocardiales bacterium]
METRASERRLLSRRLHPVVAVLIVAATALAILLGVDYASDSWGGRLDRAVGGWLVAHLGRHPEPVHRLTELGGPVSIVVATLLLVIALVLLGRPRAAVLAAVAPVVAGTVTEWILKPLVDRAGVGQSFPSGHTTGFGAVAFVVVVLAWDLRPRRLPWSIQVAVSLAALGLIAGVSAALVAGGYHYATDTLGGVCVALVSVLTLALGIDAVADRRTTRC